MDSSNSPEISTFFNIFVLKGLMKKAIKKKSELSYNENDRESKSCDDLDYRRVKYKSYPGAPRILLANRKHTCKISNYYPQRSKCQKRRLSSN